MAALDHLPDPFITLPFRRGKDEMPDWNMCLKYISVNHSSNNTSSVEATFQRMNTLHRSIVQTCRSDAKALPTEDFIEHTLKPYCQLVAMAQAHLPLHGAQVHKNMLFCWRSSFDESYKNESYNGNLELLCCIYNLAASWASLAVQQAKSGTVDGVKNAFKGFQNAAGYYEMVERLLQRLPPEHIKGDLSSGSLSLLRRICLAMTHHCAYLKAENDMKGNHAMLSKIAREGGKQYEDVASIMRGSEWYTGFKKGGSATRVELLLTSMGLVLNARSHLHLAVLKADDGEVGVAIAHFESAQDYFSKLPKMPTSELRSWINSIINTVNNEHDKTIASNNSVYFMRVPKEVEAPSGLPRPLGKATEHPSFTVFESKRGEDPFFGIVPAHIATIAAKWRERQREIVSVCNKSSASMRNKASERFQKLGVTAIIEVLSGESQSRGRVPPQLRNKIESLRKDANGAEVGVVDSLVAMVKTCDDLWVACNEKIQQVRGELEAERKEDEAYVNAYGERMWRGVHHPANEVGEYHSIEAALREHEKGLQQWLVEPFGKAKGAMETCLREIARLDWPMQDLDALMPFVETKVARQQNAKVVAEVEALRKLVQRKHTVEETQEVQLRELNELLESDTVTYDLSAVEASQCDVILDKASQAISDATERVNQTVREEEQIMTEAEDTVNSLGVLQSSDPIMEKMQKVCNALESACSIYTSLRQEFGDVMRYASSALDGLEATLSSARSFAVCRKLEAESLREVLDMEIAKKISEMQQNQAAMAAIEGSKRRQDDLRKEIESLEQQQHQWEPHRAERMAEVLRRQREAAATFVEYPSPPPPPPPPPPMGFNDAPPSYESAMNSSDNPPPPPYGPL
ncbi:programmed cell death 6-interacting protein [Trypanosoma grayi]|uniref:programmed cell death 6-interacting protein n=1 Tax=Trypanosoma grayi TaxID=71804 RepID=UPI0004F48256|nr:programmed cell death 6-interacting protein [Trypanosoma grayi]KEG11458.1 programmed cell death 6-interacting protein [Trypanosoma grayi]